MGEISMASEPAALTREDAERALMAHGLNASQAFAVAGNARALAGQWSTRAPIRDRDRIAAVRAILRAHVAHLDALPSKRALHVYTDDEEFVIAASPEDADAVMRELKYDGPAMAWTQMADDWPLTVDLDNGEGPVKRTCAEWCAVRGRGYFCAENH